MIPYNFVPLTRLIVKPDWARLASQDHPFRDGLSGELAVHIHTHTPLCVGGRQDAATDQKPGQVHFYRTPDNELAIPGTSLKGMLRNVMEIACFGHFRTVEERRLGVRDLSNANNFYFRRMNTSPAKAGWLKFDHGRWWLTPCKFTRVHQKDIIDYFGIEQEEWIKSRYNSASARYQLLEKSGKELMLRFEGAETGALNATSLRKGKKSGRLVVTGQPGSDFTNEGAKKWEFIFYDEEDSSIELPQRVVDDFLFIHQESAEWAYWKRKGSLSDSSPGVPVFWRGEGNKVDTMGLAMLFRVAYKKSIHDAIRNHSRKHLEDLNPDMADLVFGHLDADGLGGLRGRVSILGALAEGTPATEWTDPTVLSAPKPTFYPAYIEQQQGKGYRTLMDNDVRLSGWKRYPVKDAEIQGPPSGAVNNKKVQIRLETVPAGTTFTTRIRFHNLRPVELGALLWVMDFGERRHLRHALGVGKPYGLGQISLALDAEQSTIRHNDPALDNDGKSVADWLKMSRIAFVDYMNYAWCSATAQDKVAWENSYPVQQLLAMADPEEGRRAQNRDELKYPGGPKAFVNAKKQNWIRGAYKDMRFEPKPQETGPLGWQGNLEALFAQIEEENRKQAMKETIRNAEGIEKHLLEIKSLMEQQDLNKTSRKNLEKAFKAAAEELENNPDHDEDVRITFIGLLETAAERYAGGDALGKQLKKLSKRFQSA